jgi:hypothetical protein
MSIPGMKILCKRPWKEGISLLVFSLLAIWSYGQKDTIGQPLPFVFAKYKLPDQKASTLAGTFYSPVRPSTNYKIHYKIKTLHYPAEPEKPKFHPLDILINSLLGLDEPAANKYSMPYKKHL